MQKSKAKDKLREKDNYSNEGFRFVPIDFLGKKSHIEVEGNTSVNIEGSKGVLEYSTDCVRVSLDSFSLSVIGRGLTLKCISPTALVVEGYITNLSFSD